MKKSELKKIINEEVNRASKINKPDLFGQQAFDELFPMGSKSESKALQALKAHDRSGIKKRMGRYAPMFVHVQYHEFEDEAGEKYSVHQSQYYNSNFKDKEPDFNPSVTVLTLTKKANPDNPSPQGKKDQRLGQIIAKTDEYIKDLKGLNITKKAS